MIPFYEQLVWQLLCMWSGTLNTNYKLNLYIYCLDLNATQNIRSNEAKYFCVCQLVLQFERKNVSRYFVNYNYKKLPNFNITSSTDFYLISPY